MADPLDNVKHLINKINKKKYQTLVNFDLNDYIIIKKSIEDV